jgi:hypothetical protein
VPRYEFLSCVTRHYLPAPCDEASKFCQALCGGANCLRAKRNLFPTQQLTHEAGGSLQTSTRPTLSRRTESARLYGHSHSR